MTREELIRIWKPYATKLTAEERRAVAQGDYSAIVRPIEPKWVVGQFMGAANNLEIKVTNIVRDGHGFYRTRFDVRDFRSNMPRRTPGIYELPELDDDGFPIEPTKDAIEQARKEGNYTSSRSLAVVGVDDEPSEEFMQKDRLKREVNMRDAFKQGIDRRRLDLIRYEKRLNDARRKGRPSTVKILETKIRRVESTLRKAA